MIPDLLTNPFLDANSDETGVTEEALVSVQTGIELRPEFENSYQEFGYEKNLTAIVEQDQNVLYSIFPNILFGRTGLQCSRLLLSKQRNRT